MISPTEALILCADLSRSAEETRKVCYLAIERRNGIVTVASTNGANALRFDFDLTKNQGLWICDVPVGSWTSPGRSFPKFDAASWGVKVVDGQLVMSKHTKSGKLAARQPAPVSLAAELSALLANWNALMRQPDQVIVDIRSSNLESAISALDNDAIAYLWSDGDSMKMTAGPSRDEQMWHLDLGTSCPEFMPYALAVGPASEAMAACFADSLWVSATDSRGPVVFRSETHAAVTMPIVT